MEPRHPLTPCFVGSGTLTEPRDMLRALETFEAVDFLWEVDGETIAEGEATLVKLMADNRSSTLAVNGCLFVNVSSFRFLDFEDEESIAIVRLHGDGTVLTLMARPDRDTEPTVRGQLRLLEESIFSLEPFPVGDEDDEDD